MPTLRALAHDPENLTSCTFFSPIGVVHTFHLRHLPTLYGPYFRKYMQKTLRKLDQTPKKAPFRTYLRTNSTDLAHFQTGASHYQYLSGKKKFVEIGLDLLKLCDTQTDRQTDGQTDGQTFFLLLIRRF